MIPPNRIAPDESVDILILRMSALGDIVHAVPAVQSLKRQLPQARIHWLSEKPYVPFLEQVGGVDRVWETNTRRWRMGLRGISEARRLIKDLRGLSFRAALDFQGLLKSAALGSLARPEIFVGFERSALRESAASLFYSKRVSLRSRKQHCVEMNLQLLTGLGLQPKGAAHIDLDIPPEATLLAEKTLDALDRRRPVLISPGAGWPTKLWPARNFGRLADRIESQLGVPALFVYGPGEEPLVREAQKTAVGRARPPVACDILELCALCLRARMMVAADTGPLHLAAALGASTVALMGPTFPWRNGPFGQPHSVVRIDAQCPNPYRRKCRNHFCMDIPVDDAFEAVKRGLSS